MNNITYGFLTSLSLIVAIGAQNAFVLKQGLSKNHIFIVCLICFLCDFALMAAGVFGVGAFLVQNQILLFVVTVCGIAFLLYYAFLNFKTALKGGENFTQEASQNSNLKTAVFTTLFVTLLNPHVYLDTVVIVGSIGAGLSATQKAEFLAGSVAASFLWFFSLGFGARLLLPLFKSKKAWQILDTIIALIMLFIAVILVKYLIYGV